VWTQQRDNATIRQPDQAKLATRNTIYINSKLKLIAKTNKATGTKNKRKKIQNSKKQYRNLSVAHRNYEKLNKFK